MANKSPAFLFYPADFISGTRLFNFEQKGKYLELLCIQYEQGHLTYDDMVFVCGNYDKKIFDKFQIDADGLYYNPRLDTEKAKRQKFVESRSKNLNAPSESKNNAHMGDHMECHMEQHMENRMENENENINDNITNTNSKSKILSFIPTLDDVKEYARSRDRLDLATAFFEYYEAGKWHDKDGKPVKCWKQKFITWCSKNEKPSSGMQASTFDTDDFFQTALRKSNEKMKARLGK